MLLAAVLALTAPDRSAAQAPVDPHALYEQRCGKCHFEHGADLARQRLTLDKDAVQVRRSSLPVERLLRDHRGVRLTDQEIKTLLGLFASGIKWGGVFQQRCAICHKSAVGFARERLELAEGRLVTKRGNRDVAEFLPTHRSVSAEEVATLLEMLRYQVETKPRP